MNSQSSVTENGLPQKILIIDDDVDYRALVKLHLSKLNNEIVLTEYDPVKEGLPKDDFDWPNYDLILMDYYFGNKETTGLDLVHENHKKDKFPPVVMLTEAGNEEVAVKSIKVGCYDYISKKTLTPETLNESLTSTWAQFKKNNKYKLDLTISQNKFDKEVFYQKLTNECETELYENDRTFVVFELNDAEELRKNIGIVGRDAMVKRLSKDTYEFLKKFTTNINVSRVNDKRFAILIGANQKNFDITACITDLCTEILSQPFQLLEKNYHYRFNIGILSLNKEEHNLDNILFTMDRALIEAADNPSDLFYSWDKDILDAQEFLHDEDNYFGPNNTEADNLDALMLAKKRLEEALEGKESAEAKLELEKEVEKQTIARAEAEIEAEKAARRRAETGEFLAKKESERAKEMSPLEKYSSHKEETIDNTFNDMALETTIENEFNDLEADPFEAQADDVELSKEEVEELEFLIQLSVDENRCELQYQPIMYLGDRDDPGKRKVFKTDVYLITKNEEKIFFHDVYEKLNSSFLKQYIDQYILRETFALLLEDKTVEYHREFIFTLTEEWFTDITLYGWLMELLKDNAHLKPENYIWFEIDVELFQEHKNKASSLITLLKKDFGFNFVINNITTTKQAVEYGKNELFDCQIVDIDCLKTLQDQNLLDIHTEKYENDKKVTSARIIGTKKLLIASNINDAMHLMEAINLHINYVSGFFIAETQNTMVLRNNFEDVEI